MNAQPLSSIDWLVSRSFSLQPIDPIRTYTAYFEAAVLKKVSEQANLSFATATTLTGPKASSRLKAKEKRNLQLEEEIKKIIGLDLLEPAIALICPHCKNVLQIGEFKGTLKCKICEKDVSRSSAKRFPIHQVPEVLKKVWVSGLWLEAYFAKFLRKLNCKTWVKVHIMGASGVPHEIDVLAIKEGNIIVAECKTGKVSRQDVFNFLTKTQDLKVHMGILALLESLPEPETKDFVKKNRLLHLIDNMKSKKDDQVLSDLKSVVPA